MYRFIMTVLGNLSIVDMTYKKFTIDDKLLGHNNEVMTQ